MRSCRNSLRPIVSTLHEVAGTLLGKQRRIVDVCGRFESLHRFCCAGKRENGFVATTVKAAMVSTVTDW